MSGERSGSDGDGKDEEGDGKDERGDGKDEGGDGTAGEECEPDALDAAGVDPVVPESAADAAGEAFAEDDEVRGFLRDIAADVRGDSSESKQLSAILYRVSDLYDSEEQTSSEEIYLNVRHIMRIKAQGGIER